MDETTRIASIVREWMEASAIRSIDAMMRYVRSTGLSMPQFSLLLRLHHGGQCVVHEVGRALGVSSAAASQLVERLVQGDLVVRSESPEDRRVRRLGLTAKGRALVARSAKERDRWVDDLVENLDGRERAGLLRWLPSLIEAEKKLPLRTKPPGSLDEISAPRERP
jgi:DNA-binding MarR family transcriptional regulator